MGETHLRLTVLGCGSSGGVPRVGGDWGACDPANPRNRRTRCSLLVQQWRGGKAGAAEAATTVLIDTSPDLRTQLLAADVRRLDGVVYTHDHADQSHGIDDLRPIAYLMRRRLPVYMDAPTGQSLTERFSYCFFGAHGYPPILEHVGVLQPGGKIAIDGPGGPLRMEPLMQHHGVIHSLGFRFGAAAYSNDVVALPPETLARLQGLEVWLVDALRRTPHPSHAHLDLSLAWATEIGARRVFLTNMHIDLDYDAVRAETPAHVEPAYDGLTIELAGEPNDGLAFVSSEPAD